MRVFISWSGERSKHVAVGLHQWLPKVIQAVKPWMSKQDIGAGTDWLHELRGELSKDSFWIICLT